MCVVEHLLLSGHGFVSTDIRTQTFRDHALSCPFLVIMDPGRSNHIFWKGGVPLILKRCHIPEEAKYMK